MTANDKRLLKFIDHVIDQTNEGEPLQLEAWHLRREVMGDITLEGTT